MTGYSAITFFQGGGNSGCEMERGITGDDYSPVVIKISLSFLSLGYLPSLSQPLSSQSRSPVLSTFLLSVYFFILELDREFILS
jgi:hypothetical protein